MNNNSSLFWCALNGVYCSKHKTNTQGGGGNRFEYPKYVWSPSGGWWCNPRHWRRNTAYAMIICGMLGGVMFYVSSRLEVIRLCCWYHGKFDVCML